MGSSGPHHAPCNKLATGKSAFPHPCGGAFGGPGAAVARVRRAARLPGKPIPVPALAWRPLVILVSLVLALAVPGAAQCPGDCNGDGAVGIDELVAAVGAGLTGCATARTCVPRGIVTDPEVQLPNPAGPTVLGPGLLRINEAVYQASGFGNTFLVVTSEGNVIIDTSIAFTARAHHDALRAIDGGPVRYILLTHSHADHIGGVPLWREAGTEVIAQEGHVDFVHLERRLGPMGLHRSAAQFSLLFGLNSLPPYAPPDAPVENEGGTVLATMRFDRFHEFRLGGLTFQMLHTPGETYDHLTVWIPEYRIAFPGDNYYVSFPNISTLRGSQPRWALDYVRSLDTVASWEPEILAPSHGDPLYGRENVRRTLNRYRDAIQYVHDETVRGMNAGKDVHTLMGEIRLPPELAQDEAYGSVAWSVRGIYEGYIGWFDANVSNMYATPPRAVYAELAELAGGVEVVARRATELVERGDLRRALHMADVALEAEPANVTALRAKRNAVAQLLAASRNVNERGWLNAARIELDARLGVGEGN